MRWYLQILCLKRKEFHHHDAFPIANLYVLYDALETDWCFCDLRPFWDCINLANGTSYLGHPSKIQYIQIKWTSGRDGFAKILCPIYLHLDECHIAHNLYEMPVSIIQLLTSDCVTLQCAIELYLHQQFPSVQLSKDKGLFPRIDD